MAQVVWKFKLEKVDDIVKVEVPKGARVLFIREQASVNWYDICVWVQCDSEVKEKETLTFRIAGTGHKLDVVWEGKLYEAKNMEYLNSFYMGNGMLVLHAYLYREPNKIPYRKTDIGFCNCC